MAQIVGNSDILHSGTFFGDYLPGLHAALAKGRKALLSARDNQQVETHAHSRRIQSRAMAADKFQRPAVQKGRSDAWQHRLCDARHPRAELVTMTLSAK